jgi:hypothetical protein
MKPRNELRVKLISDFLTITTTDAQQRWWLMQGVEHHRKLYPAFDKRVLNANNYRAHLILSVLLNIRTKR